MAGHRKLLQKRRTARYMRKRFPAVVLRDLQGKGQVRQRSIAADLSYSCFNCFLMALIISLRSVLVTFGSSEK
jgi:hypothetical protein